MEILPVRSTCGTPSLAQSICTAEGLLFLPPCLIRHPGVGCWCSAVGRRCRLVGFGGWSLGGAPCLCAESLSGGERRKTVKQQQGSWGVREEKWGEVERWQSASQSGGGWMLMVMRSVRTSERMGLFLSLVRTLCGGVMVCHRGGVGCQLWWWSWTPPQQRVTLCSPASSPLSSLPPFLLDPSLSPLPLSCCYLHHLHWQPAQVVELQHQCC